MLIASLKGILIKIIGFWYGVKLKTKLLLKVTKLHINKTNNKKTTLLGSVLRN